MPFASNNQRRWAHTKAGTSALGGAGKVKEWDQASKGMDLPRKKTPISKAKTSKRYDVVAPAALK